MNYALTVELYQSLDHLKLKIVSRNKKNSFIMCFNENFMVSNRRIKYIFHASFKVPLHNFFAMFNSMQRPSLSNHFFDLIRSYRL